jgi:short subunit dehydrogenase-like uncharacterized protein
MNMLEGKPATKKPASRTGDKLLKTALATTAANIARIEARERGEKPAKTKAAKPKKEKKMSGLDAAAKVVTESKEPLTAQDIIKAMADKGLWKSPGGKTPHATIYAAMVREITEKGKDSRFKKVDRGMFAANR